MKEFLMIKHQTLQGVFITSHNVKTLNVRK